MDKIAIVGDLHFAPGCDNSCIKDHVVAGQHAWISSMVSDLKSQGIDKIVFLGDTFTNHHMISVDAMEYAISLFGTVLKDFQIFMVAGNHDFVYEDSSEKTSVRALSLLPNVHLYVDSVGKHELLGKTWYFVPWVIPEGADKVSKWLVKLGNRPEVQCENTVIVGHFDMIGALMEAGQISDHGFEPKKFLNAAKYTFSGHYHCRSELNQGDRKIIYAGSPYQLSFAHVGTDCGYYIMSDDGNVEFVENTVSPRFVECVDTDLDNLPDLSNCFVRYFHLSTRSADEAFEYKRKVTEKNPIYIKPIPYGDTAGSIDEQRDTDNAETRKILSMEPIEMVDMYLNTHPEILPTFHSGEEPIAKIKQFLLNITEKG